MQGTQARKPLARGSLAHRLQGKEPFAYFADFFAVCFFGCLDWTAFPGGTQPHPQFFFLANRITPYPPDSRILSLLPAARAGNHRCTVSRNPVEGDTRGTSFPPA